MSSNQQLISNDLNEDQITIEPNLEPKIGVKLASKLPSCMSRTYRLAANLAVALILVYILWSLLIHFGPKRKILTEKDVIEDQLRRIEDIVSFVVMIKQFI